MNSFLRVHLIIISLALSYIAHSQCTTATLNWDNLDYYYNSGNNTAPYGTSGGTYVSDAQAQTQKFAIGPSYLTIAASAAPIVHGENSLHTGNIAGYTGDDAYFVPTAANQTITITFATAVTDAKFTLYDIDASNKTNTRINVDAYNTASTAINVAVALQASTILTTTNNNATGTYITTSGTTLANADNRGAATITVAGPVKEIRLTIVTLGSDPDFFLSDIIACVTGTFTTDYHKMTSAKPFTGQPDYFITTPDNNSVYMIDPATGRAWHLFTDASNTYINSIAYDQVNHVLYYISESTTADAANKTLKKYDFNTEITSVVLADIGATLSMPTFDQGVQSGAAAFYEGALYIGIEGGRFSTTDTRESIIWKIEFNAGLTPNNAYQVFSLPAYNAAGNTAHDWGDFVVKDGKIIDFNTARQGSSPYTYPLSSYIHYDLMTGAVVNNYVNPTSATAYAGQAGMDWSGNLYSIRDVVQKYNMNGTLGTAVPITVVKGPAWVGNAGDASEPFKPKGDFGDAPASYEGTGDPAVHERDTALHLGATFDREWSKIGATTLANADGSDEDALPYTDVFNPDADIYWVGVSVYNNTGAPATLIGWFDYDGDGVFETSEAITETVISKPSQQTVYLRWYSAISSLPKGTYTYLRLRLTSAANGMMAVNPTGYFANGEVEDYRVIIDNYPLTTSNLTFNAQKVPAFKSLVQWTGSTDKDLMTYYVQRSTDSKQWQTIGEVAKEEIITEKKYTWLDNGPGTGKNYYRLQLVYRSGVSKLSETRVVDFSTETSVLLTPNHTKNSTKLIVTAAEKAEAVVAITNAHGATVHKQQVILLKGVNTIPLSLSFLPSGTYIVHLFANRTTNTQKLIIE